MTDRWWKWLAMEGGAPALWAAFGLRSPAFAPATPPRADTLRAARAAAPQPAGGPRR